MTSIFPDEDRKELQNAKNLLENPGLAAKITNLIGTPIEKGLEFLPKKLAGQIGEITQTALLKSTDAAIFTMKNIPGESSSNNWHKLGVAITGGAGGFFGTAALAFELPISTTIMLRSIADIARSQGESISDIETKLACLHVFALGGNSKSDDGTESGYYAVRAVLATQIAKAAEYIAMKSLDENITKLTAEKGAPIIIEIITKIAAKFQKEVALKAAAQSMPLIGAAGGALVNTIFIDHFQDMAKGHFIVRKLERKHGKDVVKHLYVELPKLG